MASIVTTTTLRNNLADVLKEVAKKRDYLLVTKKGGRSRLWSTLIFLRT